MKERLEEDIRILREMQESDMMPEYQALLMDEINYLICVLRLKENEVNYGKETELGRI
jgi:hypothetical protein